MRNSLDKLYIYSVPRFFIKWFWLFNSSDNNLIVNPVLFLNEYLTRIFDSIDKLITDELND